ncbi:diguanylate cyclase [Marivita sp. S2033]|uniref:sensor domain-containing diguanylate cyclase n=1 Tax=Marivita sp. S2033 TaxID=3373187 RepID=UPI003981A34B
MSGHVLIIDAQTNRRIQLSAQVKVACDDVALAETPTGGMAQIRQRAPGVVIIAHDLPGLKLRQFCRTLRAQTQTQLTTIIVAVPCENHSARVSALIAGAHDLIEYTAEPSELRARLRNVMRTRQSSEETRKHASVDHARGFAEAATGFAQRTVATFISAGSGDHCAKMAAALQSDNGFVARLDDVQSVRRHPDPDTDVFVLYQGGQPLEARDLLGALRSHSNSRHSRILFVADDDPGAASPLDLGAHDQVPDTVSSAELALRIKRLARLKQDEDRDRKTLVELGEKAYTDILTGLKNRAFADEYLQKTDRTLAEHPKALAILIADVDHFKKINDNHGHEAGDFILSHIASVLKSSLREGDTLARYGGEEFLIVLPGVGPGQARCIGERLLQAVADHPSGLENGPHVRATVSIGVALTARSERKSTKDLRRAADSALYRAKREGRNRIEMANAADFNASAAGHPYSLTQLTG